MIAKLKLLFKRLLLPNTYSSDAYISYLRKKGIKIGGGCYIWSPNHTFIDVQRPEMLEIGDYCKITKGVTILCHDYSMSVARRVYRTHTGDARKTIIGNNVFIGMNAIVLMGSTIGNNCIIGAGTVVSGKFGDNFVIAGNPAKVICTLDEYYNRHKRKEYDSAKLYYLELKKSRNVEPTVKDMGNAFAWMYLPRTEETLEKYSSLFRLSGDNVEEIKEDFLKSEGLFNTYEDFIKSIVEENTLND